MGKNIVLGTMTALVAVFVSIYVHIVNVANQPLEHEVIRDTDNLIVSDEILVLSGWIGSKTAYIMDAPSESSDIVCELAFNDKIEYAYYDDSWYEIVNAECIGYIKSTNILNEDTGYESYEQYELDKIIGHTDYDAPYTSGFKSYMSYKTITSRSSKQYKLQNEYAETGDCGIRMVNGRYCVALGSHFTSNIGQYFDLILTNGTVIPCILADQKADIHTDSNNIVTEHNGCMSEFVIDMAYLNSSAKSYGDISKCKEEWGYPIKTVKVYNKNVFDE